ncbi:hypothetical protein ACNOYE_08900 [Nannocystaceae bacterium ST9]
MPGLPGRRNAPMTMLQARRRAGRLRRPMKATPEQFKLLSRWHARLEPQRALDLTGETQDEDHRWYVALDAWEHEGETHELRGPPAVPRIVGNIRLAADRFGAASTHLFSGFRGTGKTTELSRLADELTRLGDFAILRVSARDYHPLTRSLSIDELALLLAAGIGEAAQALLGDKQLDEATKEGVWTRIRASLERAFKQTNLVLKFGPFELRSALWQGESASANLRKLLGGRADLIKEFLHEFVREITLAVHPRQVVVIVDDLEKYDAPTDRVGTIYREMADLFFNSPDLLKLPHCHVIYTVPPYLSFIHTGIGEKYDQRMHVLPSIKLRAPRPEHTAFAPGIAALNALLAERVDLVALFGGERDACTHRLIATSGGNLRDLFSLMRLTIESALAVGMPVGLKEVERSIQQIAAFRPLLKEPFLLLRDIERQGDLTDVGTDRQAGLALAMDQHLLLCYWNGVFWYDTHPLIEPQLERHHDKPPPGSNSNE